MFLGVTQGPWWDSIFDGTLLGPGFCSPSGGKGKKGGGKGKDCRAPQDNSAEHEKSVSTGLHRGEKKLYVGEGLFTKSVDIFNIVQ